MRAIILALAILVAGCSASVPYLNSGYATVKAMRETCTERLQAQLMAKPRAEECRELSNKLEAALDIAFDTQDPTTREGQLRLAQSLIVQLERLMLEKTQ